MHWPAPTLTHEVEHDRGPVLVTVEYRIDPENRKAFLAALEGWPKSAAVMAPMPGAYSKTPPRRADFWRRSSLNRGMNICVSTSV